MTKGRSSEFRSTGDTLNLTLLSSNVPELILHALAVETAQKVALVLSNRDIDCGKFSIVASGEASSGLGSFSVTNVKLDISFEGKGEKSQYLNAVEFGQFSVQDLATVIGKFINVCWTLELNGEFIGEGIAHFYDPGDDLNSSRS